MKMTSKSGAAIAAAAATLFLAGATMSTVKIGPAVPEQVTLAAEIAQLRELDVGTLRARWRVVFRKDAPFHLPRHLLFAVLAYRLQADQLGDLDAESQRLLGHALAQGFVLHGRSDLALKLGDDLGRRTGRRRTRSRVSSRIRLHKCGAAP